MILVLTIRVWPNWLMGLLRRLGGLKWKLESSSSQGFRVLEPCAVIPVPDGVNVMYELGEPARTDIIDMEP